MPNISNLQLALQTGTDNTYFATWAFKETVKKNTTTSTTSSSSSSTTTTVKIGSYVTIKSGATYYNGVSIPSWVKNDTWKVVQISGDRAVLGQNKSGTQNIQSPINVKYLTVSGSSSSSSSSGSTSGSTTTTTTDVKNVDHYSVKWYYATGDGVMFVGSSSDEKSKQATYNAPSNATKVKISVKAVAKTHKVNGKDVAYWTSNWVSKTILVSSTKPSKPNAPSVEIDNYSLTATLDNITDPRADQIEFEIYKVNKRVSTSTVKVITCRASYKFTASPGDDYRVRCRAINLYGKDKIYSDWSEYSGSTGTAPSTPGSIKYIKALSETSVQIDWDGVKNATSYEIQYTTKKMYFDSGEVSNYTVESNVSHAEITGIASGETYFFRVRAVNNQGKSGWTEIKSITLGKAPSAPTTWSSKTTAIVGESLTLYWVHNSIDGSSQVKAELELNANGNKTVQTIINTTDEDEKDKTSKYAINTSSYSEGTKLEWRVRTCGVTGEYGDWSIKRTVNIYASATISVSVTNQNGNSISTVTSFPFYISGTTYPSSQTPIGYYVEITSNEMYETVDSIGNDKVVRQGESVYSQYFKTNEQLLLLLSAGNIDLANGISYDVKVTASMNTGLSATSYSAFYVNWNEVEYEPDAEIGIDETTYSAYISPYCLNDNGVAISDILLSVYRKEFDGSFTELATNISTLSNTYILDPHPSLDYARYRIVATSISTGAVSYYDPPGYPIGGDAVIIQWDDEWVNFDTEVGDDLESPPWVGSMLKLPYNIDVTDNNNPDVTFVSYIGREHPVSYYGTQVGSTSSWNVVIPATDKDTLYALRRLSRWRGDVYVREPSGSGYWANIRVTINQKHCDVTIPVTLDITRVEGGK